jgi:uncharacterized membrane protein YgdD (TMEM256/DUF423 family)
MHPRHALAWAGSLGATGVILGAFGVHALRSTLDAAGTREVWDTASRYQLLHAVALVGFAGWLRASPTPPCRAATWAVRLWASGTLLFSVSLYALALGGPRWLGPVTPVGGAALIAGWVCAACAARAS